MMTPFLFRLPGRFIAGAVVSLTTALAAAATALPYAVELTPSGVLKDITLLDGTPIIERLGDFVLQSKTTDAAGKVSHGHAGGPYGDDYIVDTEETKGARGVTYKVEARHPRFNYAVTYVCEPSSIKVNVDFKPIDMKIEGGHVQMIFPVKFAPDFVTADPQFRTDNVRFTTTSGLLTLVFDNINWARHGANGLRGFNSDRKVVNFYLSPRDLDRPEAMNLKFEIQLSGLKPSR